MSSQWIGFALVKLPDGAAVESVLFDLRVGKKQLRWELLHRKSYGLGGRLESLVTNRTSTEAPAAWVERALPVIDCSHCPGHFSVATGPENECLLVVLPDEANCGSPLPQDITALLFDLC
jgi:hypothetical protein